MITLNTYSSPKFQQRTTVFTSAPQLKQTTPALKCLRYVGFGSWFNKNPEEIYEDNMHDRPYTGKGYLKRFIVGDNVDASGVAIVTRDEIHVGDNFKAKSLNSETIAKIGSNAFVPSGIKSQKGCISVDDGLYTNSLSAKFNITLGSIYKLKEIHFTEKGMKELQLKSEDINKNPILHTAFIGNNKMLYHNDKNNEKIKVYLDNKASLKVEIPTEDETILDKFEFYTGSDKKLIDKKDINVSKPSDRKREKEEREQELDEESKKQDEEDRWLHSSFT